MTPEEFDAKLLLLGARRHTRASSNYLVWQGSSSRLPMKLLCLRDFGGSGGITSFRNYQEAIDAVIDANGAQETYTWR